MSSSQGNSGRGCRYRPPHFCPRFVCVRASVCVRVRDIIWVYGMQGKGASASAQPQPQSSTGQEQPAASASPRPPQSEPQLPHTPRPPEAAAPAAPVRAAVCHLLAVEWVTVGRTCHGGSSAPTHSEPLPCTWHLPSTYHAGNPALPLYATVVPSAPTQLHTLAASRESQAAPRAVVACALYHSTRSGGLLWCLVLYMLHTLWWHSTRYGGPTRPWHARMARHDGPFYTHSSRCGGPVRHGGP